MFELVDKDRTGFLDLAEWLFMVRAISDDLTFNDTIDDYSFSCENNIPGCDPAMGLDRAALCSESMLARTSPIEWDDYLKRIVALQADDYRTKCYRMFELVDKDRTGFLDLAEWLFLVRALDNDQTIDGTIDDYSSWCENDIPGCDPATGLDRAGVCAFLTHRSPTELDDIFKRIVALQATTTPEPTTTMPAPMTATKP